VALGLLLVLDLVLDLVLEDLLLVFVVKTIGATVSNQKVLVLGFAFLDLVLEDLNYVEELHSKSLVFLFDSLDQISLIKKQFTFVPNTLRQNL